MDSITFQCFDPIALHRSSVAVRRIFSDTPTRPARGDEARFGNSPSPTAAPRRLSPSVHENRTSTLYNYTIIHTLSIFVNSFFEKF